MVYFIKYLTKEDGVYSARAKQRLVDEEEGVSKHSADALSAVWLPS